MDPTSGIDCLVFSTSIQDEKDLESAASVFNKISGIKDWSVDLDNWESVLRIEGINLQPSIIKKCCLRRESSFVKCHLLDISN